MRGEKKKSQLEILSEPQKRKNKPQTFSLCASHKKGHPPEDKRERAAEGRWQKERGWLSCSLTVPRTILCQSKGQSAVVKTLFLTSSHSERARLDWPLHYRRKA